MTVVLHPRKIRFATKIRTQMEHEVAEKVIKVLRENVDIFAFSSWDMTGILPKVAIHHLNVDLKAKPCETKVESLWSREKCHYQSEGGEAFGRRHVERIQFPKWLSNVVRVSKGAGKWRMRIDFQDLNKVYPKDHYSFSRIDHLVDSTCGFELLSMMDAYQGYHQIRLFPRDTLKVFFLVAAYGTFGSVRMLFGLRNEGATYERMEDSVFHDQLGQNMEVYVDDMLEKTLKAAYHVKDFEEVF